MTRFDAVVFDLDNTLCRSEQSGETLYRGAFEHAGLDPVGSPEDLWTALEGVRDHDARDRLRRGFERVLASRGVEGDAEALAAGFLATVDPTAVTAMPGAAEALAAARAAGPVGLLTNGPERRQAPKLRALGLDGAFDATVFAGDLPRRKPHPDPFERVLATLGVPAAGTLYVGDSPTHDVEGAYAAGMQAALVTGGYDHGEFPEVDPGYVLDSVGEVAALLDGEGDGGE